jgi:hypothetical protein
VLWRLIICRGVRTASSVRASHAPHPRTKAVVIVPPNARRGEKVGKISASVIADPLPKALRVRIHFTPEASSSERRASPRLQRARMLKDDSQLCNTK